MCLSVLSVHSEGRGSNRGAVSVFVTFVVMSVCSVCLRHRGSPCQDDVGAREEHDVCQAEWLLLARPPKPGFKTSCLIKFKLSLKQKCSICFKLAATLL